jgi:hypothetical protein
MPLNRGLTLREGDSLRSSDQRKAGTPSSYAVVFILLFTIPGFLSLFGPSGAVHAASLTGDSSTILRMREKFDNRKDYPLYEYLNLSADSLWRQGFLSAHFGGWGRVDLRSQRTGTPNDTAMQYGHIGYSGKKDNLSFQAGRQFIAEGVATERLDGLYLRNDLAAGFTAAAFVGSPVVTQPDSTGGDLLYGARIAHAISRYYTAGISALRVDAGGDRLREEAGIDLWIHPLDKVDITGRSTYNSITSNWMEHSYSLAVAPVKAMRIHADLSAVNYRDYFHNVTTNALRLKTGFIDPLERVFSLGGSVSYTAFSRINLSVDYKNYQYDIAGHAKYYGGKASLFLPAALTAGISVHRMEGANAKLRFDEYRVFVSKRLGKADLTADLFSVNYDSPINGIKNTYSAVAAASYDVTGQWKVTADVEYGKTVDFDSRVSAMIKLVYLFDVKFDQGERAKREK